MNSSVLLKYKTNENTISCYLFDPLLVNEEISYSYGAASIVTGVLSILVVFFNGAVLTSLISLRFFSKSPTILLVILTFIDFMHGITVLPMYTVYMRFMVSGRIHCPSSRILIVFGYTLNLMSSAVIFLIAFQLYFGTVRPFLYNRLVNRFRLKAIVVVLFVLLVTTVLFITFVKLDYWKWFKACVGGLFLTVYVFLWAAYVRIIFSTKKSNKAMAVISNAMKNLVTLEHKLTHMVVTIILVFGICYLPYIIYAVYMTLFGLSVSTRSYFGPWIEIIGMSNSLFDPIVYCIRMKSVRNRVMKLLLKKTYYGTNKLSHTKIGIVSVSVLPLILSVNKIEHFTNKTFNIYTTHKYLQPSSNNLNELTLHSNGKKINLKP